MKLAGVALSGVLVALAWRVGRARPEHRPIAWFITAGLIADLIHWALLVLVLAPARSALGAAPYEGWSRVAFHVQQGAVLAYPVGLAALALVVLLRRAPWSAFAVYGASLAGLVASYPGLRGRELALAYQRIDLVVTIVVIGAVVMWWWRREVPRITVVSTLVLGLMQAGKLLALRDPFRHWDFAGVLYLVAYGALLVLHLEEVVWPRSSSA